MEMKSPAMPLNGFSQAAINLFQEALVDNNEHLLHAIETAASLWVKKKMCLFIDTDESVKDNTVPVGWRLYHHHATQKSVLVPLNNGPRVYEVEDIICWVKYKGGWTPIMMRAKSDFAQNRYRAGRLFNFIHGLHTDIQCTNLQAFYDTAIMDSTEAVLAVEPEVIEWIVADNKKY